MTAPQLGIEYQAFQRLMPFSVRNILLLSSVYDYYIFEEDGQLFELLRNEYHGFNLRRIPEIVHVTTGEEALNLARGSRRFDLIITTLHIEDMAATEFARRLREVDHHTPIVLLAYDNRELAELQGRGDVSLFERLFIWQGDYRILLGIIKDIEDRFNVENDTRIAGVQVIILIEDSVRYYSAFLPIIYAEVLHHTQRLIREGRNLTHRYLRVRARPKILLCTTYEEALDYYTRYEDNVLGIISDVAFPKNGELDTQAGLHFAETVRTRHPDIPVILQSNAVGERGAAASIGAAFLLKDSPVLLQDLRRFMVELFAFGDFVFHTPDGQEVGRASDLRSLERELGRVPEESVRFHAERNHFSNWLKARTEFRLAHRLRPRKPTDYPNLQALRDDIINSLRDYRKARERGIVADFVAQEFDPDDGFARLGGGSLGGKARGLAFVNRVLANAKLDKTFSTVRVLVPAAIAVGTDVFDAFLDDNDLRTFALGDVDDHELTRRFLEAERFPDEIVASLQGILEVLRCPLAVRSSSLLEDSQYHPFAGVYGTYMLPNNEATDEERLGALLRAIKRVYASTFYRAAKEYMRATSYRLEEEKMAVLIQRLVGSVHHERFYPDISGVGRSYNFYPVGPQAPGDGIANVALGLGRLVVGGGSGLRLCPRYPDHLPQFPTVKDTIKNSQQLFYALRLDSQPLAIDATDDSLVDSFRIDDADADGTLRWVGSTYVPDNEAIYDGLSRRGRRVVTFAPILKQKLFPLPEIVSELLSIGTRTMGTSVEIEFAARLSSTDEAPPEFGLLQIRPLVRSMEAEEVDIGSVARHELVCASSHVLGNGVVRNVRDIVFVDPLRFERGKSRSVAEQISELNRELVRAERPYLLVGVGRWGSLDPWLGIPVRWEQISGARTIIETSFADFEVTPSQGSHFFQNITAFKVGYFTVQSTSSDFVDWDWLRGLEKERDLDAVGLVRLERPLTVKMNGKRNVGIVLKP